jgi:hypothetical protein
LDQDEEAREQSSKEWKKQLYLINSLITNCSSSPTYWFFLSRIGTNLTSNLTSWERRRITEKIIWRNSTCFSLLFKLHSQIETQMVFCYWTRCRSTILRWRNYICGQFLIMSNPIKRIKWILSSIVFWSPNMFFNLWWRRINGDLVRWQHDVGEREGTMEACSYWRERKINGTW